MVVPPLVARQLSGREMRLWRTGWSGALSLMVGEGIPMWL